MTRELTQVMLDIETLGRERGCVVTSIGAAKFGPDGVGDSFHRRISITDAMMHGLEVEGETLKWWLEQDDDAQQELIGTNSLPNALEGLARFYGDADEVWANAPAFDCEILEAAFEAVGMETPWSFRDERCHRTLREFPQKADVEQVGVEHNAENDAIYQAAVAHKTLDRLGYYDEG